MYLEQNGRDTLAPLVQKSDILYILTVPNSPKSPGPSSTLLCPCCDAAKRVYGVALNARARVINRSPTLKSGDDLREEAKI